MPRFFFFYYLFKGLHLKFDWCNFTKWPRAIANHILSFFKERLIIPSHVHKVFGVTILYKYYEPEAEKCQNVFFFMIGWKAFIWNSIYVISLIITHCLVHLWRHFLSIKKSINCQSQRCNIDLKTISLYLSHFPFDEWRGKVCYPSMIVTRGR